MYVTYCSYVLWDKFPVMFLLFLADIFEIVSSGKYLVLVCDPSARPTARGRSLKVPTEPGLSSNSVFASYKFCL